MRRHLLERASEELTEELEDDPAAPDARRLFVEAFGPRTAAWLVMRVRRQLHLRGAVDLKLPERLTETVRERNRWFFAAVDLLRRRPGWAVEVSTHRSTRCFRVRWLSWRFWTRFSARPRLAPRAVGRSS